MASAKGLIKKVAAVIKKVGPMSRISYLRTVVLTGGDELIGRDGTVNNTDSIFNPQPIYHQLGHRQAMFLSSSTQQLVADDYKFTFPTTLNSELDFQAANSYIVLKDTNGEERFRILYVNSESYLGQDVVMSVFARSMGHAYVAPPASFVLEDGNSLLLLENGGSLLLQ